MVLVGSLEDVMAEEVVEEGAAKMEVMVVVAKERVETLAATAVLLLRTARALARILAVRSLSSVAAGWAAQLPATRLCVNATRRR